MRQRTAIRRPVPLPAALPAPAPARPEELIDPALLARGRELAAGRCPDCRRPLALLLVRPDAPGAFEPRHGDAGGPRLALVCEIGALAERGARPLPNPLHGDRIWGFCAFRRSLGILPSTPGLAAGLRLA